MIRSLLLAPCLCSALVAEPIPWERKVKEGKAVLEYLDMEGAVPRATVKIKPRLAIPRIPNAGEHDTIVLMSDQIVSIIDLAHQPSV